MIVIDYKDTRPIYEQVCEKFKVLILKGVLAPDEQIPSVRNLAMELSINPNTIQKAYRILEDEGLIQSHSGAKSYVSVSPEQREKIREQLLCDNVRQLVQALRQSGVEKPEALALVERLWDE